jgi:hypothetical protein
VVRARLLGQLLARQLARADRDAKRIRGTLLLFPPAVLAAVAEFMGTAAAAGGAEGE